MIKTYCDGFSSPKKKTSAGVAVFIEDEHGNFVHSSLIYRNPRSTNNEMELEAITTALNIIRNELGHIRDDIILISDSKVAVGLTSGRYQTKKPHLQPLVERARDAIERTKLFMSGKVTLKWEPRHTNKAGKMIESFRGEREFQD